MPPFLWSAYRAIRDCAAVNFNGRSSHLIFRDNAVLYRRDFEAPARLAGRLHLENHFDGIEDEGRAPRATGPHSHIDLAAVIPAPGQAARF